MTTPDIEPIPDDFQPHIADDGRVLKWSGPLPFAAGQFEFGLRPARNSEDLAAAGDDLRNHVWRLHEWARLGRTDLIHHASTARHKRA